MIWFGRTGLPHNPPRHPGHPLHRPDDLIKDALLCSGRHDHVAVSLSYRREYVNFTRETNEQLSPLRHIDRIACPVTIDYGSYEAPEFQRQAQEFADALKNRKRFATLIQADGYNYFDTIETLGTPSAS